MPEKATSPQRIEGSQKFGTDVSPCEMAAKPDTAKYSSSFQLRNTA